MPAKRPDTAILHYSAPPIIGGVEAVIKAHVNVFAANGYPVTVVAGRGNQASLPKGTELVLIPEMDSQNQEVLQVSSVLENGQLPPRFEKVVSRLVKALSPVVTSHDTIIIHNIFTKHFNLPLTAALVQLLDRGAIKNCIAWCHDFTWTSPYSRTKVHPGYPWDLLRTYRSEVTYVTVSRRRQATLANLLSCDLTRIHVIYNGVDPRRLLGLTAEGWQLANRLDLFESDLILLMPVRITHAKNIEFALRVVASLRNRGCRPKLILTGPPDPHDVQSMDYFHSLQDLRQALEINSEMRFIFESGPHPDQPHTIDEQVIGELFRLCDVMFMPSIREGFGMPVLEAGLTGIPVVSTNVPAAEEIGNGDITLFNTDDDPDKVAELILEVVENSPIHHLKRRVRQNYTWEAIFRDQIEPLLTK
jgi:glycosyltransferase involved in cell wall biosynthesis